jgi:LPXTG-motif cell wall-anchored protein
MINNSSTYWIVFAGLALLILGATLYRRRLTYKKSQLAHIALDAQFNDELETLRSSITKSYSK